MTARKNECLLTEGSVTAHVTRKKIKNLYLRVREPDGRVEISAPARMPEEEIRRFLKSRLEWILAAQDKVKRAAAQKDTLPVEVPFEERENRARLHLLLARLIRKWEPVMGVKSAGFTIKKMKTRWGSCNVRTGHLNFNYELCRKDERLIEYVVVHELTHLLEPSHNERFWALMEHYLPGAKQLRKELNNRKEI